MLIPVSELLFKLFKFSYLKNSALNEENVSISISIG